MPSHRVYASRKRDAAMQGKKEKNRGGALAEVTRRRPANRIRQLATALEAEAAVGVLAES